MRSLNYSLLLVACLGLAGCSRSTAVDVLDISKPSRETTSSILPSSLTPPAPVAASAAASPAPIALAEPDRLQSQALEQVAMVAPPRPSAPQRSEGSRRTVYGARFKDAHPIAFGRITPSHHAIHGVDVSRWQGNMDWDTLRQQGANFAFIKATDGGDHVDPMFRKNWNGAEAAGIRRGAYHFFYWCRVASEQADWFIRNVPKDPTALPPVIDVEWNHLSACKKRPSRAVVLEKMQVFMDRLEAHYGQRPIIYTAPDFYEDNLKGAFPNHPFWLRSVAQHPSKVYPNREWLFWQYSGSGLSKGVTGRIDLNVFHGSEREWHRWVGRVSS